jgi:hypothetical protein
MWIRKRLGVRPLVFKQKIKQESYKARIVTRKVDFVRGWEMFRFFSVSSMDALQKRVGFWI